VQTPGQVVVVELENIMIIAIAGVSGNTGKVAAETLLAAGHRIRVIVRDAAKGTPWKARGAEVAIADLNDEAALTAALTGVQAAYLLIPPNGETLDFRGHQASVTHAIAGAAEKTELPHLVFLSSVGAQHPAGTGPIAGLHVAERKLSALPKTSVTLIRAAYFMENLAGSLGLLGEGLVPSFLPAALALDMVATHDIGSLAAKLLLEGATAKTTVVELGGPTASMDDVAAILSRILGRPIAVADAPLASMAEALEGFGFKPQTAELYQEMTGGIASGHVAFEGHHRRVHATTSLETVLRKLLPA
jgi:uncharacterized protein YbjT (DUF2867 family)